MNNLLVKKLLVIALLLVSGQAVGGTLAPGLETQMAKLAEDDVIKVLVVMNDHPDVAALDKSLYSANVSLAARHTAVVSTLQEAATAGQADLLRSLAADKALGGIEGYTPHWIVNAVVVKGTVASIRELAQRSDVETIEPDLQVELIEPVMIKEAVAPGQKSTQGFVLPGVQVVGADRVWHELGITGAGSVVANMDSGVDGSHPALNARWRGNWVPQNEAWFDVAGVGSPNFPADPVGHGSHVMGTITGATAFDTVGVAPASQWIAVNAILGTFEQFDNNVIAGFEWLADPDGDPNTSDDVPDVCHNSWGVMAGGPFLACDSRWWSVIDNCEAAGVVVTFSAGNEGPYPSTLRSPGNRATSPTNGFTIGSTSLNPPYLVSNFSSRGPSKCGGEFAMKPEVMAPGESIYSCLPGGGYGFMDGTSMAGPHVAGVVALMREAAPDLDVVTIKEVLMMTSRDLGVAGEDNNYGHGMVDAYAAVTMVMGNVNTVSGFVTNEATGQPVAGAVVRDLRGNTTATAAADGAYQFTVLAGATTLQATEFGYVDLNLEVVLVGGEQTVADLVMVPMPAATVSGVVRGPDGTPLAGAEITALGTPVAPVITDSEGQYSLSLPAGVEAAYELMAMAPNLAYAVNYLGLQADRTLDFDLPEIQSDGFESGGFETLPWQSAGTVPFSVDNSVAHEGVHSARTGAIADNGSSELSLGYYLPLADEFSFWYKVDSEIAYDTLKLYVDGELDGTWSGVVDWALHEVSLEAGHHNLRWVYAKDGSASSGADAAWIDLVSLPGAGVVQTAAVTLGSTSVEGTTDAATTTLVNLQIGNAGTLGLEYSVTVELANPALPMWASVSPATDLVYPTSVRDLGITLDARVLGAGTHFAELVIASNDPAHPDTTVSVAFTVLGVSAVGENIPRSLTLTGAVPNPFNPATDIHFSLPATAHTSLRVYDVSGRLVRTLVDRQLAPGAYSERWDGRDEKGQGAASGIYFIRVTAADETSIKAMTLVR
ncbi:MAG: S8 family serine peptidase [Candidatus Krumholzibacteria bacterium]|nr:S8 family serine peptidase [Candidatus Krumholzibacteria bacterium]